MSRFAHAQLGRRTVLGMGAGLSMVGLARAEPLASGMTSVVKTTNGPVVGLVRDGIPTFAGLRYGAPPTGALRFTSPRKPTPWTTPAAALRFGPACIQMIGGGGAAKYPGTIGPALDQLMTAQEDVIRQSEDCLFLNVWTPALDNKARPVMVWFHGGGYSYGSGAWPVYDGHNLAKRHDVVVVTVNHRLNVFGFLNTASIGGDPASGNAGMSDLVLVLEWVRDNIAGFGGDPGRVTTFGQSGGGAKSALAMTMPGAKGLVHRAIVQSGPALRVGEQEAGASLTRSIMAKLGVTDLKGLQAVPVPVLLSVAGNTWGPMIDGVSVTQHPFDPVNPQIADIPVMVGCTSDEQTLYNVGFDWWGKLTEAELATKLRPQYKDKTEALIAAAKRQRPKDSPSYLYTDIMSKTVFIPSATLAERKATQRAPVYMYVWEWGAPADDGIMKAPHTMELPFIFDNVEKGPMFLGKDPSIFTLGKAASSAWTAFARTGDPNAPGGGLPKWPRFDAKTRATMMFNTRSRIENDPYAEFRALTPNASMFG
ncbi:MAG: carboxylesterase family protein [Caulobacteraceae bacterium]